MQENSSQIAINFILDKIKSYYGMKSDKDLADFLGIKQNTISSWRFRNTIDWQLIFEKCKEISMDWLLNEGDDIAKSNAKITKSNKSPCNEMENIDPQSTLLLMLEKKDREIRNMAEEIGALKEQVRSLKKQNGYSNSSIAAEP